MAPGGAAAFQLVLWQHKLESSATGVSSYNSNNNNNNEDGGVGEGSGQPLGLQQVTQSLSGRRGPKGKRTYRVVIGECDAGASDAPLAGKQLPWACLLRGGRAAAPKGTSRGWAGTSGMRPVRRAPDVCVYPYLGGPVSALRMVACGLCVGGVASRSRSGLRV